ncbi:programmed cell death protein 2 [Caerostris darwini]|uniref:Programmed cell death protein 2 n=1 Tax=Caerostris darwini TaxID=1538125 RepID=A0AAV4WZ15_9ARAC|nr:programmed cell death protein 2 [Caerostris darwini]
MPVELGFVSKRAPWKLKSKFFPSKLGGFPAWLRLNNLPDRSDITCKTCKKPLQFLLQVYAPIPEVDSAFHRTIFLFACDKYLCNKPFDNLNFVVFRSQLPRQNDFYSFDPPVYNEKLSSEPSAEKFQPVCCICGCAASLKCSKCNEVDYCSESHREYDLQNNHQKDCGKNVEEEKGRKNKGRINNFLLPEYELVTETEELPSEDEPEKTDEDKMKEYRQFMQSSKAPKEMQDMPLDDLDTLMQFKDKAFSKFQKRIKLEPEQVLRYQRGETPLWASAEHVPTSGDIPDCICGAKRIFEFQVMPQLLNYLPLNPDIELLKTGKDSVDWATLAIYTCSKSCEKGFEGYVKEFVWKQDFTNNETIK